MDNKEPYMVIKKGERIEKLKEKYQIDEMSINNYQKLSKLDYTRFVLKSCVVISGIIFVIDLIIPDPVFLIDEVALGTITTSFKMFDSIVLSKIGDLIKNNKVELSYNDLKDITSLTNDVVKTMIKK